jgi:hypothetical protein
LNNIPFATIDNEVPAYSSKSAERELEDYSGGPFLRDERALIDVAANITAERLVCVGQGYGFRFDMIFLSY